MPKDDELEFLEHPRNVQYTTKVARLLNQTETGIARVLADEPENFLERQYGRLFIALDINFTSDFYDVGEVLVDTLRKAFYADLNKTVGESFEHALGIANQTLADLAAEGQNDWVGKLNAVVCVLHENQIYVTAVGSAKAYMIRGHSSTDITEGLSQGGQETTAKTFLNISSGELEVGDKLLIATDELVKHLSITDIRRTLYLHSPAKAIQKIADHVTDKGMPGRLATIVIELTTIDIVSAEAVTSEPEELILSAPRRHFETLSKFKPLRKDTPIARGVDKAKKYWEKRAKPGLSRTAAQTKHRAASWNAKRKGVAPPPPPPRAAAGTPEVHHHKPSHHQEKTEGATGQLGQASHRAGQSLQSAGRAIESSLRPVTQGIRTLWHKTGIPKTTLWQRFSGFIQPGLDRLKTSSIKGQLTGSRRILYRNLLIAILVVFVLSLFMAINAAQTKKAEAKVRDKIQAVEALQAKAEASFIFKDTDGARKQLAEAKDQADALGKEKVLKPDIAKLQASINVSYNRINNVITVTAQPVADFKAAGKDLWPTHVAQSGTTIYAIGDTGALVSYNQSNKEIKTASANPGIQGKVRSMATTSNGDLLMLTDKPSVVQYDSAGSKVNEVPVSAGSAWESGNSIDAVQQNAFILDPDKNQIWRHTRTLSAFNKGEPYLAGAADLKDTVDLVTGAQVYVLKPDGKVLRFSGGNQQNFNLAGPPAPQDKVIGAGALAVNFTTNSIYVADPKGKRVIEYSNGGAYVRQFTGDAFGGLKDIAVDDKTNTLFALAAGKLWQINLNQ